MAELVERSRALRLAERVEWHKLLHYLPRLRGGLESMVDSPGFFNAPQGKTDPQAELEATLAAFAVALEETPQRQSAQCAFVARYAWLDGELGFDAKRLPRLPCKRYEEWRATLNAKALTLVFASAYLNNPATMYGHTLLRVDGRDQDERTRLLAYSISFAANTDETSGLVFAVKGLLGGYPGGYTVLPYYRKVSEYSDLENRDLWEYELNFTPEEIERILRHAWELLPAYFEYYFFDENCSYHLLRLLQVARPELDLASPFRWYALPTDTVRAITAQPGLAAKIVYRPAAASLIAARLNGMDERERRLTKELSVRGLAATDAQLAGLPAARAAAVLETAHEYVGYRRAGGYADVADPAALARELLVARSRIDVPSQAPALAPPSSRPDQGHGTARAGFGGGRLDGRNFAELRLRPVYHDILDADEGYVRGAQLEFFNFSVRRYGGDDPTTQIESFIPIDILSLTPRDEFFQSRSWRLAAGWQRAFTRSGSRPLATTFEGGGGGTWSAGGSVMLYALLDAGLRLHSDLDENYALGAGARVGGLIDLGPRLRLHLYARALNQFLGERDEPGAAGLESRFSLGRDLALRFDLARNREGGRSFNSGNASLLLYY